MPSDPAEYLKQYPALIEKVYKSGLPVSPKVTEDDVAWHGRRFPLRKPKPKFTWNSIAENKHGMMENMFCMMMQNQMMQLQPSAALARNMKPMMRAMEDAPVRMTPAPSGILALEDKPRVIPAAETRIIKRKKRKKRRHVEPTPVEAIVEKEVVASDDVEPSRKSIMEALLEREDAKKKAAKPAVKAKESKAAKPAVPAKPAKPAVKVPKAKAPLKKPAAVSGKKK